MTFMSVYRRLHLSVGEERGKEMPTHPSHPNILLKDVENDCYFLSFHID